MKDALVPGALISYFTNGLPVKLGDAEFCDEAAEGEREREGRNGTNFGRLHFAEGLRMV